MAMEHFEKVEKQILATDDILDNEEAELSYALAHFMNVLRESNVDIPTSTTREISLAIADVARDPKMYPKLLNEKWIRNLMKSFIAKNEDQSRIFDTQFSQALEMGLKREEIKERAKYNIAMASIGNHVIQKLPSEFKNNLKNSYTAPGNKERSIADVPVTDTIKKMIDFLAKKGFDPRSSPIIRGKVANILRSSRTRPVSDKDIDHDFEPIFLDAITEQFENDVKSFNESHKIDEWLSSKQEYDEYQRKFSTPDFTEEWMIDVIMHLYGSTTPSLDAAINEFFMVQHQQAIENAIDAKTRAKEDGGVNPNFLLGAINDYLKSKHGDNNVPRIYDFPLRTAMISEAIDIDAATSAAAIIGGSKTYKDVRKQDIPQSYGNNLVNRSLFLRALKRHVRSELSTLASILAPNISDDELESISQSVKGLRDELETREKKERQALSTANEDIFSDFYATVKTAQSDVSLISKATTPRGRMVGNLIKFIDRAIQIKKIKWTFTEGPKKGQTIEVIDNLDDYLEFRKEYKSSKRSDVEKIGDLIQGGMKNAAGAGKPKPFLSRKDMRDLERTISSIPDAEKRRITREAFDVDFEKYKKNYDDSIVSMMEKSAQSDNFKEHFSDMVRKVNIPVDSLLKLGNLVERSGNDELKKKFKSLVDKKSSFSSSEMKNLLDIAKQLQDKKSIKSLESMFDAKISTSDASKIKDAMSRAGKIPSAGKVSKLLDSNTFSGKEIEKINELLQSADASSKSRIQEILDNMKFSKAEAGKIESLARQDPSLQKAVQDAFGEDKTSINKIKKLNDAINATTDDALKKKLKRSIDGMEFSSSGMNDLAAAMESLVDKKIKSSMERLASKKLTANDASVLDDLARDVASITDEKSRKSIEKAISNVDFNFKGFDKLNDAIDAIDNKYDIKDALKGVVGKKSVSFEGKDIDDITSMIDALSRSEKNDAEDMIDAARFNGSKTRDIASSLDDMDNDEQVKERIRKGIESIEGKSIDADAIQKAKKAIKDVDKDIRDKIDDILGHAEKAGEQNQRNELADMYDAMADRMDASTDANGSKLKTRDIEAWKWSKESAEFLRKHAKGLRAGTENPSDVFDQMSEGKDLNLVIRRLAKTPDADKIAMDWMSSMHEMMNKIADDATTEEQRALFSQVATKMERAKGKVEDFSKQCTIDKELKDRAIKANQHNIAMKEKANERLRSAKKWFDEHGLDLNTELRDRVTRAVRSDPAGSNLIPPAGAERLDFGKHGRRDDTIHLASKKRRFIVPDFEDVKFFPEIGDERTPFAVVNFAGDQIGDSLISQIEKFGNFSTSEAIGKLEGEGPEGTGGVDGPGGDPSAVYENIVKNLENVTEEDVLRDWSQKLGQEMGNQLVDELVENVSNEKPMPNPIDQLDIEGDIDIPHSQSPFDKDKSGKQRMMVDSKDPRVKKKPQGPPGGPQGPPGGPPGGQPGGPKGPGGPQGPPGGQPVGSQTDYVDVDIDFQDAVKDLTNDFISGAKDLNGAQYDGSGIIDPEEWFERGKKLTNSDVEKYLAEMIKTPENAAMMRRYFRSFFRKPLSDILKMKHGKRKLSATDGRATIHRAMRNGRDPRTDAIPVTKIVHRVAKSVKRDIFTVDISGSMSSYLGVVSQLIASLAEPQYLKVVLFDTDAIPIDPTVFKKNPAVIFHDTKAFIEESAKKLNRTWEGHGSTSYSRAFGEFGDEPGKIKIAKGDRLVLIGDLEHNTLANTPDESKKYTELFDNWKKEGICKPSHQEFDCIAAWYASLCSKADSCIAINPKVSVGGMTQDLTCSLLDHGVPTCFTGALSGSDGKATENNNYVLGEGLKRTVDCLKMAMTGEKPKINERVANFCQKSGTGTVNPFLEGDD